MADAPRDERIEHAVNALQQATVQIGYLRRLLREGEDSLVTVKRALDRAVTMLQGR